MTFPTAKAWLPQRYIQMRQREADEWRVRQLCRKLGRDRVIAIARETAVRTGGTMTQDYRYIRAWGRHLGSMPYYIEDEIERARAEGAPPNAIYRRDTGGWETTDDIRNPDTRAAVERMAGEVT